MSTQSDFHPLYIQIADAFRENIRTGRWTQGSKIPTELALCDYYHVSRITIRKAIDELAREKLLVRQQGKGTFVAQYAADATEHSTLVKSFTQELLEQGKQVTTLKATVIKNIADPQIANHLQIEPGAEILELIRVRGTGNDILAYFKTYVPYRPSFSLKASDYYGSFYEYLGQQRIFMTQEQEYVEAIMPTKELQQQLKISQATAVLKRVRFTTSAKEDFHEYTECYYIGNKYRYYFDFSH